MAKKQTAPAYSSYNSHQLTDKQVRRAVKSLECELLEDSGDNLAGILLALLRSFTYTQDDTRRESMLIAAEAALAPCLGVVSDAIEQLSIRARHSLIREGGTQ
jgi:hypothetical protein